MQLASCFLVTLSAINGYGTYNFRVAPATVRMGSVLTKASHSQEFQTGNVESETHWQRFTEKHPSPLVT